MSCFIVEDITINRILAFIEACNYSREGILGAVSSSAPVRLDVEQCGKAKREYGEKMYEMNLAAFRARYGDSKHINTDPDVPFVFAVVDTPEPIQALKSLDCFLYQCSEGGIPDSWMLYGRLDRFRESLSRVIMSMSNEYEDADWG